MATDFKLTEEAIENTDMYDREGNNYICQYLVDFFKSKKYALKNHIRQIECFDHGMEEFTISDEENYGMHGFCFNKTFGDWENTLFLHWDAKFSCGKKFPIGFYFMFIVKDLVKTTKKLSELSDIRLATGYEFDEKNKLDVITGFRRNNLTKIY